MEQELALQNLFLYLVENGFRLGVRDYKDALKALRLGYGLSGRQNLLRLCQTLWARTEEEKRFLDTLFNQFSFAVDEATRSLMNQPESSVPGDGELPENYRDSLEQKSGEKPVTDAATAPPAMNFSFAANQEGGIGLTRARVEAGYGGGGEYFILSPRSIVSMRRLTIIWRRFKAVKREGPKTEFDLQATVKEKCSRGIISQPVLVPARRNQAKLNVLIDASPSMTPWYEFNKTLVSSLGRGQLGGVRVFYFHNVPEEVLYEKETLNKPQKIAEAVKENRDAGLLIVSDGGAARGYKNRERISETKKFLADVAPFWQPVAWLNPMPARRWQNTTAEALKQLLNGNMYHLSEEGLIKAIDVLRGKKF